MQVVRLLHVSSPAGRMIDRGPTPARPESDASAVKFRVSQVRGPADLQRITLDDRARPIRQITCTKFMC